MLKIRLLDHANQLVGDAEIERCGAESGRDFPDVVRWGGFSYHLDTGAAFDRSAVDAVYRRSWVVQVERVSQPTANVNRVETTLTGARMPLEAGETTAAAAEALAAAAKPESKGFCRPTPGGGV